MSETSVFLSAVEEVLECGEQRRIKVAVSEKVYEMERNPALRASLYQGIHRGIKNQFGVTSYKDLKRQDMLRVLRFIDSWLPK